jgi:type IV fimbrial biogenesis protein FimT
VLSSRLAGGFSLVELMVTVAVFAMLATLAAPSLGTWAANSRVRSAAESLQNGLRLAQGEATRRSRLTAFVLTDATPSLTAGPATSGGSWFVRTLPSLGMSDATDEDFVESDNYAQQAGVTISGPAALCFNALGRPVSRENPGIEAQCSSPASADRPHVYNIESSNSDRPLRVQVHLGGRIRMCDPARLLSSGAPDGC